MYALSTATGVFDLAGQVRQRSFCSLRLVISASSALAQSTNHFVIVRSKIRIVNNTATIVRWAASGVSALWAVALYVSGFHLATDLRHALAYLPSAAGLLVVGFDLWFWKAPLIRKVSGRPRIYGTWAATLQPSKDSHIPEGGNKGPITAAVVIEQTFFTTAIRQYTEESSSKSDTSTITADRDARQGKTLYFTYSNIVTPEHAPRSPAHHGAALLDVVGDAPASLSGMYWTARLTTGSMSLTLVDRKTDRPGDEAIAAVQPAPPASP